MEFSFPEKQKKKVKKEGKKKDREKGKKEKKKPSFLASLKVKERRRNQLFTLPKKTEKAEKTAL